MVGTLEALFNEDARHETAEALSQKSLDTMVVSPTCNETVEVINSLKYNKAAGLD